MIGLEFLGWTPNEGSEEDVLMHCILYTAKILKGPHPSENIRKERREKFELSAERVLN
jgi:hypothetical protein